MAYGCIFVSHFMVQAVVRAEPALRDRAIAIIEGTAPVWSVVGMNDAAMRAGIAIGMTKSQVQQFCEIEIRHRSLAQEKAAHAALLDLGWSVSPRVEDTAADTVVVDLAGLNSLFGSDEKIARQLAERALSLGFITQIATTTKIDVAILAARGFPGITVIPEGEEREFLASLPVNVLAPSPETLETLDRWGVRTCGALAALPVLQLSERLGQEGVRLHELAEARSERSIVLAEQAVHFEEEMELEDAVEELEPLSFLLGRLLDQLCARLAARALAACAVQVKFELEPSFEEEFQLVRNSSRASRQTIRGSNNAKAPNKKAASMSDLKIRPPKNHGPAPQKLGAKIYERALALPIPVRDSKILLNLVRLHLQGDPPSAPILKIMLAAEAARPRAMQGGLFLPSAPDPEKLELTLARLANLVGDDDVGSPELVDTHRPGEFRMRRFIPPRDAMENRRGMPRAASSANGKRAVVAESTDAATEPTREVKQESCATRIAFRIFRPALPASVELREGCPARVDFQGMRGRVLAASGPWRSSGDWWREDGWQNDEWDLEIHFGGAPETRVVRTPEARFDVAGRQSPPPRGFYRIFYDVIRKEWFVRGAYD
jgi:protein ImuB